MLLWSFTAILQNHEMPNLFTSKDIDNMMFAIVAIHDIVLDYMVVAENITSWDAHIA